MNKLPTARLLTVAEINAMSEQELAAYKRRAPSLCIQNRVDSRTGLQTQQVKPEKAPTGTPVKAKGKKAQDPLQSAQAQLECHLAVAEKATCPKARQKALEKASERLTFIEFYLQEQGLEAVRDMKIEGILCDD